MTAYTTITPALVAVGAKPFATTIQALRDNPIAIAECDASAPVNAAEWHPYNKAFNNDANTGRIWSTAVDGAQAIITTPDFADGWDYGFLFDNVNSSALGGNLQVNLFRETGGAYAGVSSTGISLASATNIVTGFFAILNLRLNRNAHFCEGFVRSGPSSDSATVTTSAISGGATHATSQKITRLQFSLSSGGNFQGTGAAIYMLKRRNVAS